MGRLRRLISGLRGNVKILTSEETAGNENTDKIINQLRILCRYSQITLSENVIRAAI